MNTKIKTAARRTSNGIRYSIKKLFLMMFGVALLVSLIVMSLFILAFRLAQ